MSEALNKLKRQLQGRNINIIYTIKMRLIKVYICIYMFICTELIEETGRPPGLIFAMWGYFLHGSDNFVSWNFFTHLTKL